MIFVPMLNVVESRYDCGRTLEDLSLTEDLERSETFEFEPGPGCNPGSGLRRKLGGAEGLRSELGCGVESECCSSASEYSGGSSRSAIMHHGAVDC